MSHTGKFAQEFLFTYRTSTHFFFTLSCCLFIEFKQRFYGVIDAHRFFLCVASNIIFRN